MYECVDIYGDGKLLFETVGEHFTLSESVVQVENRNNAWVVFVTNQEQFPKRYAAHKDRYMDFSGYTSKDQRHAQKTLKLFLDATGARFDEGTVTSPAYLTLSDESELALFRLLVEAPWGPSQKPDDILEAILRRSRNRQT